MKARTITIDCAIRPWPGAATSSVFSGAVFGSSDIRYPPARPARSRLVTDSTACYSRNMYSVDSRDTVLPLPDVPQSSAGAPCPIVLADEHTLILAYYLAARDQATIDDSVAIVTFEGYDAMMFGPPNDAAFKGYPLAARGLSPYRAHEIKG